MKFDEWLREQREYQAETYGVDYEHMARDADNLTAYTTMNLNAAFLELAEAQQETPWKPWAKTDKGDAWRENRDKFIGELVDVLFFIGNALAAVDCTDEELNVRYGTKMGVNKQRQAAGYDGTNKCLDCGRVFDDTGVVVALRGTNGDICDRCAKNYDDLEERGA